MSEALLQPVRGLEMTKGGAIDKDAYSSFPIVAQPSQTPPRGSCKHLNMPASCLATRPLQVPSVWAIGDVTDRMALTPGQHNHCNDQYNTLYLWWEFSIGRCAWRSRQVSRVPAQYTVLKLWLFMLSNVTDRMALTPGEQGPSTVCSHCTESVVVIAEQCDGPHGADARSAHPFKMQSA